MACFSTERQSQVIKALSYSAVNSPPTPAEMNMRHIPLDQSETIHTFW